MINLEEEARKRRDRLLNNNAGKSTEDAPKEAQDIRNEIADAKAVSKRSKNDTFEAPEGLLDAEGAEILTMDSQ